MSDVSRWLKIREAAERARCGPKTIYRAVQSGQLRAVRLGGRRELRFLESWIDDWLLREIPAGDCEGHIAMDAAAPRGVSVSLR
jgi:excisionase family DNA binding protein